MTAALVERLPDAIAGGLVVVPRGHADRPAIGPVRLVEAADVRIVESEHFDAPFAESPKNRSPACFACIVSQYIAL